MSDLLWRIETPDEELDRLERELIEHELEHGFDFNACESCTPDELRAQAIHDFNEPEPTFDSPEWLDFIKDMDGADVRLTQSESETDTPITH